MGSQRRLLLVLLYWTAMLHFGFGLALADDRKIDSEHLFGFLTGTDIGAVGEREIESESTGRFSKRTGSYAVLSQMYAIEYTPCKIFDWSWALFLALMRYPA